MKEKVVLAFSGGLDTSFCVPYLKQEKGLEVHTVMVNTGGGSLPRRRVVLSRGLWSLEQPLT
jgi:argininosuccinate synthase